MKEKPIIFKSDMVRAILDDRKSQTRRVVKCHLEITDTATPNEWNIGRADDRMALFEDWGPRTGCALFKSKDTIFAMKCPYGQPGDRLWVRETWRLWDSGLCGCGGDVCACPPEGTPMYAADEPHEATRKELGPWKPSIHMFRKYSRLTLEILKIRVERVQDISLQDKAAEGIPLNKPMREFSELWDSINGKKYPWKSNPWVWIIEFKKGVLL